MVIAFKDLCVDVADLEQAAAFLGPLLGLAPTRQEAAVWRLGDDQPQHTVWLNRVPEPRAVKNRVHLDVDVARVADALAAGAVVVDDTQPWTVLTHEQIGELCAFVRPLERLRAFRLYEVVVDAADSTAIATWWGDRFGVAVEQEEGETYAGLNDPARLPYELVFTQVPEPKVVKNRVHFDVVGDVAELLDAGARLLRARDDSIDWDVLADPEGNEFCVFAREARP